MVTTNLRTPVRGDDTATHPRRGNSGLGLTRFGATASTGAHMPVGERGLPMELTTAQLDRAVGVLLGTAAGDALGASE